MYVRMYMVYTQSSIDFSDAMNLLYIPRVSTIAHLKLMCLCNYYYPNCDKYWQSMVNICGILG